MPEVVAQGQGRSRALTRRVVVAPHYRGDPHRTASAPALSRARGAREEIPCAYLLHPQGPPQTHASNDPIRDRYQLPADREPIRQGLSRWRPQDRVLEALL